MHVVDDDHAVLGAIKALLESEGLQSRTYPSAFNFLESYDASAGCLVVDLRMPEMTGLELQEKFKKVGGALPVIFLTGYGDVDVAVEAMKAGAIDFIQKPYEEKNLLDSIYAALKQDRVTRSLCLDSKQIEKNVSTLTERETEIMNMLLKSLSNKEIARTLDISPRTVEVHRRNIMKKLGIKSVAELIMLMN